MDDRRFRKMGQDPLVEHPVETLVVGRFFVDRQARFPGRVFPRTVPADGPEIQVQVFLEQFFQRQPGERFVQGETLSAIVE